MQSFQGDPVPGNSLALRNHRPVPGESKPAKIGLHCGDEFRATSRAIQIVVAQNHPAAGGTRALRADPEGARMTEVQKAGRRGSEAPAIVRIRWSQSPQPCANCREAQLQIGVDGGPSWFSENPCPNCFAST